jgi:long-chain acyl-CoA synthetase
MNEDNMEAIDTVLGRMSQNQSAPALYWQNTEYSYADFLALIDVWSERLPALEVTQGTVCGVLGEYSPQVCALFFALLRARAILVPFSYAAEPEMPVFLTLAGVQKMFRFDANDHWAFDIFTDATPSDLITSFLDRGTPGLIVFTSGSTGKPKGILHDCESVMRKFVAEREGWRTVLFLMIDHFGGFNTLLSTFAYHGTAICLPERTTEVVCRVIEQSRATLLPTTPTFLNLLIASATYKSSDLSSIRLITYGTELMPEATLSKVHAIFPNAQIKQTYGLSELGVLRSKSEDDGSVWVKVGGAGFEVKVIDGVLWVRSEANMVGYLNAPSPFDADGWMCTGDQVEVKGEYIRFLGRKSEIINVGGQKVFPVEVETVLLQDANVREATVFGVKHPLMGQVAHARVSLYRPEEPELLTERLRMLCLTQLAKYKVPLRFIMVDEEAQHGARFKKIRPGFGEGQGDQ